MRFMVWQTISCAGGTLDEKVMEQVTDALFDLEECDPVISDIDVAASLATGKADVQMAVTADSPQAALEKASATVRAALHAAGYSTPEWESVSLHAEPVLV